ncbi:hypothetical protein CK203_034320 [Vitis vinifera]|uniref:Retrotransposon gag domain-containing protein n=1 Tax=Vitis vinifera TaxID=29760 RepID=A0A438INH0_VITVI|nr:hypothetical protein CK203_034320 [Vitis vinifera]
MSIFLMTVVAATFGALSEVQLMHAIYHFKAQEVNNPMLQNGAQFGVETKKLQPLQVNHSKLKEAFCKFPDICRQAGSWEPQGGSQLCSPARIAFCCEVISQPFLSVCEISQTPFSLAKWSLEHPDICYRHWEIFYIRFLLSKSQNTPCCREGSSARMQSSVVSAINEEEVKSFSDFYDFLELPTLGKLLDSKETSISYLLRAFEGKSKVINFVDYSLNQGAPAGHESAGTPTGHESKMAPLPGKINEGPYASTSYECTIMLVPPTEQLVIRPYLVPLLPIFHGMESENPYAHIKKFEDVCNTFQEGGASIDLMRLKLFPFTLKDKAKIWLNSLRPRTKENEKFYECWERYMEAINACPHHGFDTWLLVSYFYDGMSSSMKQLLETMCGGDFMSKNPEEAMDFLSYVADVSRGWDEPTKGEVGKMKSQLGAFNAKAGMYTLKER